MSTFIDIHDLPGVKAEDVAGAHAADVRVQEQYGVDYRHYWVDEAAGKVFCLVDAPDRETAARVHREAHGLGSPGPPRGGAGRLTFCRPSPGGATGRPRHGAAAGRDNAKEARCHATMRRSRAAAAGQAFRPANQVSSEGSRPA